MIFDEWDKTSLLLIEMIEPAVSTRPLTSETNDNRINQLDSSFIHNTIQKKFHK